MSKVRLAIIGNGMVGHRFIEDLLDKSDAANFDITVFCEEPRIAYDRVHLSSYFSHHTAEELSLVREGFYEKHGIKVLVGERAITINRQEKVIHSSAGRTVFYDKLIMATGSYPWIPPIKGSDTQDCFVYRTIEDLNAIESCARRSKRGAVVGGGLLGNYLFNYALSVSSTPNTVRGIQSAILAVFLVCVIIFVSGNFKTFNVKNPIAILLSRGGIFGYWRRTDKCCFFNSYVFVYDERCSGVFGGCYFLFPMRKHYIYIYKNGLFRIRYEGAACDYPCCGYRRVHRFDFK